VLSECYPYTTLVGASELGYLLERPPYKRKPKSVPLAQFRPHRAATCDELIARLAMPSSADPPLDLLCHRETRALVEQRSPLADVAYKRRENLIDAVICAWTAALMSGLLATPSDCLAGAGFAACVTTVLPRATNSR
jgi:hypothetical protein